MPRLRVGPLAGFARATFLVAFVGTVIGCGSAPDESAPLECAAELDMLEQPYTGNVTANPNPLTLWHYATAPEHVSAAREAIECAVQRFRAATCLPFDVSVDAHHWARILPAQDMPDAYGRIGGTWASSRIRVREDSSSYCDVLMHELGHHLLRRRNDHVAPAAPSAGLHEALLAQICSTNDCQCFVPEQPPPPQ